jgi:atypical dual specificity phosphatase
VNQDVQSITENIWWVIPDQIGGMRKPTAAEIIVLQAAGICGIVSVMDDSANLDLYQQLGMAYLWLPIKGGTAPNAQQIQEFSKFVQQQNSKGNGILVHCTSGRKRTGTFLAAYLISLGQTYENAIEVIQNANPAVELSALQIDFLKEFYKNRN